MLSTAYIFGSGEKAYISIEESVFSSIFLFPPLIFDIIRFLISFNKKKNPLNSSSYIHTPTPTHHPHTHAHTHTAYNTKK